MHVSEHPETEAAKQNKLTWKQNSEKFRHPLEICSALETAASAQAPPPKKVNVTPINRHFKSVPLYFITLASIQLGYFQQMEA